MALTTSWSNIKDYRDSCKRINTRINPAVENVIARNIEVASNGMRCAWCEVGECVSGNTTTINQDDIDDFNVWFSSHNK